MLNLSYFKRTIKKFLFLIIKLQKYLMQNCKSDKIFFTFLRHAQTYYNVKTDQVRIKCNNHNQSIQDNSQYKKIRYEKKLMDCSITEEGQAQCMHISKIIENQQFDLVIISPMRRTLETCHHVLQNMRTRKNVNFIVQPLITQRISSACNISNRVQQSMKDFQYVNFDAVKDNKKGWLLEILPSQIKQKILQAKKMNQSKEISDLTLQLMMKYGSLQKNYNLIQRAKKARSKLIELKVKFSANKVLVIGHSIFFRYLLAADIDEDQSHQIQAIMQNCQLVTKAFPSHN